MLVRDHLMNVVNVDRSKYGSDEDFYKAIVHIKFRVKLQAPTNGMENIRDFLREKSQPKYNG
jgi:hypothetical protein